MTLNVVLYQLGALRELRTRVEKGVREAEQRGDLYLVSACCNGYPNALWLASNEPDEAGELVSSIMRRWTQSAFLIQHFFALVARVQTALYRGDHAAAARWLHQTDGPLRQSRLLATASCQIMHGDLVARAAIAAAVHSTDASVRRATAASQVVRKFERMKSPWNIGIARVIDGQLAVLHAPDRAPRAIGLAIDACDAAGMEMHGAACRYLRGKLMGGDGGRADLDAALDYFRREKVVAPDAFVGMLLPAAHALR